MADCAPPSPEQAKTPHEIPLRGMEVSHSLFSGGMNKLTVRESYKPPQTKATVELHSPQGNRCVRVMAILTVFVLDRPNHGSHGGHRSAIS